MLDLETKTIENEFNAPFQGNGEIVWSPNNDFLISLSDGPAHGEQMFNDDEEISSIDKIIFMDAQNTLGILLPEIYTEAETSRFPELSSSGLFFNNDGTVLTIMRSGFSKMSVSNLKITP